MVPLSKLPASSSGVWLAGWFATEKQSISNADTAPMRRLLPSELSSRLLFCINYVVVTN